jgi:hypothetical protein
MGAAESVPETSIHEFTVKVRRSPSRDHAPYAWWSCLFYCFSLSLAKHNFFGDFFAEQDCNGKEVSLETYKGKVLLVVNVASKWYAIFP